MIWNMHPRYKARSIGCTGGLVSAARVQFGLRGESDYVGERTTLRSMRSRFAKVSPSLASASTASPSHDISFTHRNNYALLATSIPGLDYSTRRNSSPRLSAPGKLGHGNPAVDLLSGLFPALGNYAHLPLPLCHFQLSLRVPEPMSVGHTIGV